MKTADQILDNVMCCTIEEDAEDVKENYYYRHNDVVKAIEQAQIEAYDQALIDRDNYAMEFAKWVESLSPSDRVSVWSKDGSLSGLFYMDMEQLLCKYKSKLRT